MRARQQVRRREQGPREGASLSSTEPHRGQTGDLGISKGSHGSPEAH